MRLMGRFPLGKSELRLQEAGTHTHTHTHGNLSEMHTLGPRPRPPESEAVGWTLPSGVQWASPRGFLMTGNC